MLFRSVRPKCSRKTQMALNIQPPPSTEHSQVVPYRTKVAVPPVEAPAPTCSVVMVSYRTGPVLIDSLRAALEQGAVDEVVLVDNGNGPETRREIGRAPV